MPFGQTAQRIGRQVFEHAVAPNQFPHFFTFLIKKQVHGQ